jgi:hypothetical protein
VLGEAKYKFQKHVATKLGDVVAFHPRRIISRAGLHLSEL